MFIHRWNKTKSCGAYEEQCTICGKYRFNYGYMAVSRPYRKDAEGNVRESSFKLFLRIVELKYLRPKTSRIEQFNDDLAQELKELENKK